MRSNYRGCNPGKQLTSREAEIESADLYKVLLGASEKSAEAAGKGADVRSCEFGISEGQ